LQCKEMDPWEAEEELCWSIITGAPRTFMYFGPPGVGKTVLCQGALKKAFDRVLQHCGLTYVQPMSADTPEETVGPDQCGFIKLDLPHLDPAALRGYLIPDIESGGMRVCRYEKLPEYAPGKYSVTLLLIDEFLRGTSVKAGECRDMCFALCETGKTQNLTLASNTTIVCATNPDDGSDGNIAMMGDALRRRGNLRAIMPSINAFIKHGSEIPEFTSQEVDAKGRFKRKRALFQRIHPHILSFVQAEGMNYLYNFDAEGTGRVYANPAGLHKVSTMLYISQLAKEITEGRKVPSLEELTATFPEHHFHPISLHNWLTRGQQHPEVLSYWMDIGNLEGMISGFVGNTWSAKFLTFATSADTVLTAQIILFEWETIVDKVKTLSKDQPALLIKVGFNVAEALYNMGLKDKNIRTAFTNYTKFLQHVPFDSQLHMCRQFVTHFKEMGSVGGAWKSNPRVEAWMRLFKNHPVTGGLFKTIIAEDTELSDLEQQRKLEEERVSKAESA